MKDYLSEHKRALFIVFSLFVLAFILWKTNSFFEAFKEEERTKMEIWALADKYLVEAGLDESKSITLPLNIIQSNSTIPIILVDSQNNINGTYNIKIKDTLQLLKKAKEFEKQNPPILINLDDGEEQKLYYGNSSLLNKLTYYPLVLVLIFLLFLGLIYLYYKTGKISDENKLWAGIAKETAHQIGTPLSSLIGWVELMKADDTQKIPVKELEKDIQRLNVISQRFSKIGSMPKLEHLNLIEITTQTVDYLRNRSPKSIEFKLEKERKEIFAKINPELYAWVIENLVKNAMDAMDGEGTISISFSEQNNRVLIDISDTGKGISSSKFKEIFNPGYTTKKRGWGLGLSLTKRIIETYHKGKIFVKSSKVNRGTTFRIMLFK